MARKKVAVNKYDRIQSKSKGQFVQLPNELIESDAYRSLPPGARCLLIEFMRIVFPDRNGKIGMSHDRAARLVNCTKKTAGKYIEMLLQRGFLKLVKGELWQERKAREYALTSASRQGRSPTYEYLGWREGDNFFGKEQWYAEMNQTPELE